MYIYICMYKHTHVKVYLCVNMKVYLMCKYVYTYIRILIDVAFITS